MKEVILGGLGMATIGAGVFYFPMGSDDAGKVYSMSKSEAIAMLSKDGLPTNHVPLGNGDIEATLPEGNSIEWINTDSESEDVCRAEFEEESKNTVRVKAFCTSESSFANDTSLELKNLGFREFIDSTLMRRKYETEKVQMTSAVKVISSIPKMQGEAIQKAKDSQEDFEEMVDNYKEPGEPSLDLDTYE